MTPESLRGIPSGLGRGGAATLASAALALALAASSPGSPAAPPADGGAERRSGCGSGAPAADTTQGEARALLRRAEDRYREMCSLRARFAETVRVPLLDQERSGRGIWYQKGRSLFKLDYREPPDDVIVSDGTHVWTYYPSSQPRQVTRTELERSTRGREMVDLMGRIFREASRGYRARLAGRESVTGVETHHVVLKPTGEAPYREVRLWIGVEDLLVRKFKVIEENQTVRTVTLSDLEPDAAISDSVFEFRVPEGAEVFSG